MRAGFGADELGAALGAEGLDAALAAESLGTVLPTEELLPLVAGLVVGAAALPVLGRLFKLFVVEVEDAHAVLVTRFGKLVAKLTTPGLVFWPSRLFPWVKVHSVSLARDFRLLSGVHVDDARGTTLVVDLWLEVRVVDPVRALFAVEDWDKAVRSVVVHAATAILGAREFGEILSDRDALARQLRDEVSQETARWGVQIEHTFIRNVTLLPEVARHLFASVSARLEQAKALIDEQARLDVAQLDAESLAKVAALVGQAKAQYPLEIGRALGALKARPRVFEAYAELYRLAQLRPQRTVSFRGFAKEDVRAVEGAMLDLQLAGEPKPTLP